jgi:Mce-associated membrane protein
MTTGSTPGPGWSRRRHPALVAVLAVLALLLAVACAVVVISPTAVPGTSAAERANDRVEEVTAAARKVTAAFLDVDYRDMDPRIATVLGLSTGTFKNQYTTAKVDLKAQAQQAKAVADGAVRYVGVGDIDAHRAVVYVAADTKVSNASIEQAKAAGKTVDDKRYYRFQLNLKKVGNRWLLDDLQFIS